MGSDHFAVLNPESREIEKQIPVGRGAHTIFVQPDGRALWATSRVQSRLAEIDPSTLDVRRIIELPGGPDCIAFDPDGQLWATLRWSGRIARVDTRTGEYETIRSAAARTASSSIPAEARPRAWRRPSPPAPPRMRAEAGRRILAAIVATLATLGPAAAQVPPACRAGTVYLTIDTGWGREAERIAEILQRRGVRATLFVANEPTHTGERSLAPGWAAFWRARAAEGHVFASHTDRHWYFRGDSGPGRTRYVSARGRARRCWTRRRCAANLRARSSACARPPPMPWCCRCGARRAASRRPARCPWPPPAACATRAGRRTASSATNCLPRRIPNATLARRAIANTRDGEVLVMHWGIRSRRDPYANVLDEVIGGLQARGFCFATCRRTGAGRVSAR